ncbi:5-oxoprolinase subunit PxpB [Cohnella caldifontis]|uniref:5-oxoprolinase subunit PxpB n=1 Tax=Cohnella caldifontis TaxID=3027471 RepID=UPI0023EBAEB1|nr:5-oxoprolinase subunit PxpB [Cohnella sp. YIM B05605]
MERIGVLPLGDAALLFVWPEGGQTGPADIAARVEHARRLPLPGVKEWVPAYRSAAVHLDLAALAPDGGSIADALTRLAERLVPELEKAGAASESAVARRIRLPATFGGASGPDLEACAARSGLSADRFVEEFARTEFKVAMMGFAPGFPYLSGLPDVLSQPRHGTPRMRVPAGSVGIAGSQAGVYPAESPGGWQLIARTTERLFRPESEEPFLLAPGDRVFFVPTVPAESGSGQTGPMPDEPDSESEKAALYVSAPGMLTTVQDSGRFGWRARGVSAGGGMDSVSLRLANALAGNAEGAAVLEMTLLGPSFRLERDLLIAVCGAEFDARIDGEPFPSHRPVWARKGSVLTFGRAIRGCRGYLAVAGGIDVPAVLGSRGTDLRSGFGGYRGRALAAGDGLQNGRPSPWSERLAGRLREQADQEGKAWAAVPWRIRPGALAGVTEADGVRESGSGGRRVTLRVVPGAEGETFGDEAWRSFLTEDYRVEAASDRMGVRLAGPALIRERSEELASHGVAPGTVQVPPDGKPIVLAADCQPTGGYPKIAHVIGADLPLLAQCVPGDLVGFDLVGHDEAWHAWRRSERELGTRMTGIRLKGEHGQT